MGHCVSARATNDPLGPSAPQEQNNNSYSSNEEAQNLNSNMIALISEPSDSYLVNKKLISNEPTSNFSSQLHQYTNMVSCQHQIKNRFLSLVERQQLLIQKKEEEARKIQKKLQELEAEDQHDELRQTKLKKELEEYMEVIAKHKKKLEIYQKE